MQNQQGYTITEMAEFIGVWQRTLSEWLITHGITGDIETKRYPRFSQAKFEEIKRLRAQSNHVGAWIKKKSADKTQAEQSKGGIEMKDKDDAQIRDQSPNGVHSKKNRPRTGRKDKSMNNNCSQDFEQFAADYPQSSTDYCDEPADISQEEIDATLRDEYERETSGQSQQDSGEQNVQGYYNTNSNENKSRKPIQQSGKNFLPMTTAPNFDAIPQFLKDLPRWLCWQLQLLPDKPKPTKVPMTPKNGKLVNAAVNKPENCLTFDEAISWYNRGLCTGIGFVLTNTPPKVCCVDVDHCCNDDGTLNDEAKAVMEICQNSFTEKSQSGEGTHTFFVDDDYDGDKGRKKGNVEVYATDRYIAMTGVRVQSSSTELLTVNGACRKVIAEFIGERSGTLFDKKAERTDKPTTNPDAKEIVNAPAPLSEADRNLVEYFHSDKCRNRDANMFALFSGDKGAYFKSTGKPPDDSVADIDLMLKILYYIGSSSTDNEIGHRALKIFGQSALAKREKWQREDYQLRTLNAAFDIWNQNGRKTTERERDALTALQAQPQTPERDEKIIAQIRNQCEWRGVKDEDGKFKRTTIKPSQSNFNLIFGQDPNLNRLVGYDQFSGVNVFLKRAPWHDADRTGEQWHDTDDAELHVYIRNHYEDLDHAKRIDETVIHFAHRNAFHTVKQFLASLPKWDGEERAATFFVKFLHAEDSDYTRTVTMNFLFGALARVFHPGIEFANCLVIQGAQRIGKSRSFRMLGGKEGVNPNGQNWHVALKDSVDDAHAIDALMKGWIVEIEEFTAARKAEINALKTFISATEDTRRFSYDKNASTRLRHNVFVVTCNDQAFLRDQTGNTRFIILRCSQKKFDRVPGMTPEYVRQVWAEALFKYNEQFKDDIKEVIGAKLLLPLNIQQQAEAIAETFTQDDGMTLEIKSYLDRKIPPQVIWTLLTRERRRKFIADGKIEVDQAELNTARRAKGGTDTAVQKDIDAIDTYLRRRKGVLKQTTQVKGEPPQERFILFGTEYRQHICATEIFNECFGQDKRKSMNRINEILSMMDGWTLGKRLQKVDPEYNDQSKPYYRNEDNQPVDETNENQSDNLTDEPFDPDDIPFD